MHRRDTQRGFTVIELLAVVAIVAILAVVVIPQFMQDATRGKAKSEVSAVFTELATRNDQYKTEKNVYYAPATACPSTATTGDGTNTTTDTGCTAAGWTELRVTWPSKFLRCSYTMNADTAATNPVPLAPSWVQSQLTQPATAWYFIVADCGAVDYFTASWDTKIRAEDGK